ncbi:hypothetical protein [Novosphingobium aquae]|uniref:Uncharacterized protein n=1 Tax=Novosphingobium aquae TaxID=3133435 RepID=A0ABU8S762_9SPHN
MAVSFFPLFGGTAAHQVRCRGREYSDHFDDCFNDYFPLLEMSAPIVALALLWPFLQYSFTIWSPDIQQRSRIWWFASRSESGYFWPEFQVIAGLGAAWCVWRAASYPLDHLTAGYIATWLGFAVWFLAAVWFSRPTRRRYGVD